MKVCRWCGVEKNDDAYMRCGNGARRPECKACRKARDNRTLGHRAPDNAGDVVIQHSCGVRSGDERISFTAEERARWRRNYTRMVARLRIAAMRAAR